MDQQRLGPAGRGVPPGGASLARRVRELEVQVEELQRAVVELTVMEAPNDAESEKQTDLFSEGE